MALPQLTDEQRAAALEKAAAARRARAELKDRLKRGGTNLKQVLNLPFSSDWFSVPPAAPHGQLPKLGTLHPSLVRTVQVAYQAANE